VRCSARRPVALTAAVDLLASLSASPRAARCATPAPSCATTPGAVGRRDAYAGGGGVARELPTSRHAEVIGGKAAAALDLGGHRSQHAQRCQQPGLARLRMNKSGGPRPQIALVVGDPTNLIAAHGFVVLVRVRKGAVGDEGGAVPPRQLQQFAIENAVDLSR